MWKALPVILLLSVSQHAFAGPAAAPIGRGIAPERASCGDIQSRVDLDRGRMEALMLTLNDEDDKPESPARFRRMCALDKEISSTAGRLASLIRSAPNGCLTDEDKDATTELSRLSKPIPECGKPLSPVPKAKPVLKAAPKAGAKPPVTVAKKVKPARPVGQRLIPDAPSAGVVPPDAAPGLMFGLYDPCLLRRSCLFAHSWARISAWLRGPCAISALQICA